MTISKTLNAGVIGTGGMGTRHAMNLHQFVGAAKVAAVYDLDTTRASLVAAACGNARVFDNAIHLIEDNQIDAVVIVSPDSTHLEYALACLRFGKPVMCEKPLATTAANALQIVEAERKLGRQLITVGFVRRFDPQHLAVRDVTLRTL